MYYFSSGDAPFYFKEQMSSLSWLPQVWESFKGFGVNLLPRLWIDYPFRFIVKLLSSLGLEWGIIEKLLWGGALIIGIVGIYKLETYVVGRQSAFLSILIYLTNTYALFLFGGGQLGVALAYSLSPLVLLKFIQFIDRMIDDRTSNKWQVASIQNGLWLALLVCFDLRLAYLVMGATLLYLATSFKFQVPSFKDVNNKRIVLTVYCLLSILYTIAIPFLVAMVCHLFWILPMMLVGGGVSGLGEDFTNPGMLRFLSFADFSHTLSLLHPNWPENLFGKVYFLQPEFLFLPIIAFGALIWREQRTDNREPFFAKATGRQCNDNQELRTKNPSFAQAMAGRQELIVFFSILALLGAFLSKGANPPFGEVYVWLFDHVPGFIMFRDPTKFYLFTAIGYSLLIPFTLEQITENREQTTDHYDD